MVGHHSPRHEGWERSPAGSCVVSPNWRSSHFCALAGGSAARVPSEWLLWVHGNAGAAVPARTAAGHAECQSAELLDCRRQLAVTVTGNWGPRSFLFVCMMACALWIHDSHQHQEGAQLEPVPSGKGFFLWVPVVGVYSPTWLAPSSCVCQKVSAHRYIVICTRWLKHCFR